MKQKSNTHLLATTLVNCLFCLTVLVWLFVPERKVAAQGPPPAFLGPIYYGSYMVTTIFDHDRPLLSEGEEDGNDWTQHYDGSPHNSNPPFGMGYDQHDGIDYDLNYEIVLAAAGGTVDEAGWSDPSDHTYGLGLRVKVEHSNDYITEYGHLSVLQVSTDDPIQVDPNLRHGIIGISGSTGSSTGSHLHFGLINPDGIRVNPYGWIGAPSTDPWELDPNGAPSYNVWDDYPSIIQVSQNVPLQFTDGDAINDPGVNNARMTIDDGSADFSTIDTCWIYAPGNDSFNNSYRRANANGPNDCRARWTIRPDAFTLPGDYDVFVHIPEDSTASLGAVYTVTHNLKTSRAIVVQAAYLDNNTEHNAWAYLGRYDFAMNTAVSEFIDLYDDTLADDAGNHVLADAIMLAPANGNMPLPQRYLYVSFASSGYAGNVPYEDEDILLFDAATGEWRMFFDGSDVGLASVDIDAFDFRNGHLFFSLNAPLGSFTASDIIRFVPTSLGEDTSGTMSVYIPGEKLGLTPAEFPRENVDALTFNDQGKTVLSTQGQSEIGPDIFEDEDLFISDSDISASLFFDGSEYALNTGTENVNGVWLGPAGHIYLTTTGLFAVPGTSGDGADIFICAPGIFRNCWFEPGLFWNGSAHGLGSPGANVDDFFIHPNYLIDDCETFGNGGFEAQFYCWTITENDDPAEDLWRPSTAEKRTGLFSAEARSETHLPGDNVFLISSPVPVSDDQAYRFRLWAKGIPEDVGGSMQVWGRLTWYVGDNVYQSDGFADISVQNHSEWTEFDSGFICPPSASVNRFRLVLELGTHTLSQGENLEILGVGSIFIDDISWESQPCNPTAPQD